MVKKLLILFILFTTVQSFGQANRFAGFGGASVDSNAKRFIDSTAVLNSTEKTAIYALVKQLKDSSLWNKMYAIYPMVGGTSSSCKWNLKSVYPTTSSFCLTFSGGWTFSSTGALPNGTNAYANTFWSSVTNASTTSVSMGTYLRQNTADGAKCDLGVGANPPDIYSQIFPKLTSIFYGNINTGIGVGTVANTDSKAFFLTTLNGTTNIIQRNSTQTVTAGVTGNSDNTYSVFISARNSNGTTNYYSDRDFKQHLEEIYEIVYTYTTVFCFCICG
jgi:hypothetical protein